MTGDLQALGDSRRANDFMAVAATMIIVAVVVLRAAGLFGVSLGAAPALIAGIAYAVTISRRDWQLLTAVAGLVLALGVSWALAEAMDAPWQSDPFEVFGLLVVWAPWPTLHNRRALLVLWALATAPFLMLMVGPPFLDLSWAEPLLEGERIFGRVGFNEIGIPAALAVIAALALRMERDTWPRYAWSAVSLTLVAAAGTRVVLPALALAAVAFTVEGRRLGAWRGWAVEALPWLAYVIVSVRPMFLRTVEGLGEGGLDQASSGRLHILAEYWAHAREILVTGRGVGTTRTLLDTGQVDVNFLPHNGFMTLMIDVGIPAMVIAIVALSAYVLVRMARVDGEGRWLLRVPLLVLLPALFVFDHGLMKAFLTVPIILFATAAPWLSRELAGRHPSIESAVDEDLDRPESHVR